MGKSAAAQRILASVRSTTSWTQLGLTKGITGESSATAVGGSVSTTRLGGEVGRGWVLGNEVSSERGLGAGEVADGNDE
jgi:hypothetical protein